MGRPMRLDPELDALIQTLRTLLLMEDYRAAHAIAQRIRKSISAQLRRGWGTRPVICPQCRTEFVPNIGGRPQIYCSSTCCIQANNVRKCKRVHQERMSRRIGRVCPVCNDPIPTDRSNRAVYCSDRCSDRMKCQLEREAKRNV